MQFHKSPLALVGALLAAVAVGLTSTHNGIQAKQANSSVPFQDDDLDGLDNAMEVRFGSNPFKANVDGDGLNDLAEILLGTDPSVADSNASLPALSPRVQLEAYQVGGSFVLQSFMLRKHSVKSVHFYIAQSDPLSSNPYAPPLTQRLGKNAFSKYVDRFETLPMSLPGYAITSMRLVLPSAPFLRAESFAIAVVAVLDNGIKVADEVRFGTMDGILVEWRGASAPILNGWSAQGGTTSSGQPGGLFPADPTVGAPLGEHLENQVCVQTVGAVGLHGIGIVYAVTEAECDTLFGAVCLAECTLSVGGTFLGLDLPSLLQ